MRRAAWLMWRKVQEGRGHGAEEEVVAAEGRAACRRAWLRGAA